MGLMGHNRTHLLMHRQVIPAPSDQSVGILGVTHVQHKVRIFLYGYILSFFRATPTAYGSSQARGGIGTIAASLRHSHSNASSKPCLKPTPQLMAMPDP